MKSCARSLGDGYLLGICLWSVYSSGQYLSVVGILLWPVLVSGWPVFVENSLSVFRLCHLAEVIRPGVGDDGKTELVLLIT